MEPRPMPVKVKRRRDQVRICRTAPGRSDRASWRASGLECGLGTRDRLHETAE